MLISEYRTMWILIAFDISTETKADKKEYVKFRKTLLKNGFIMLQWSFYARHCSSKENCESHVARIKNNLPVNGQVRIIEITDKQFGRMQVFENNNIVENEKPLEQLLLF